MNTRYLKITLISLFFFFPILSVQAANSLDVVINEIAWMGTEIFSNDEWLELFNNTNSPIELEGWQIVHTAEKDKKGFVVNLSGTIPPQEFYLLERTDETTLPEIDADKIYTGALNNKGEFLRLVDSQGTIIDEIDCIGGWSAGNNKTKQTMERVNPKAPGNNSQNWQTSQSPGGTPRAKNSIVIIQPSEEPSPRPEIQSKEPQPEEKSVETKELTAALTETFSEEKIQKDFFFVLSVALILAFISGFLILFLKRKLEELTKDKN